MSEKIRLRLAGGAQGFNWLPVFVAEEQGLFDKHGLALEYLKMGSVDKATQAVVENTADLAITPPEGAIADYVRGGELRVVASNSNRLPMSLVAAPSITSIGELKGKRIGTSSLTEGTAIYTRIMLDEAGLRYPDDYQFVLAGVHTKRWEALQAGEIDCAPQPAPWNFLAQNAGYRLIKEVSDSIPEIVFAALVSSRGWLQANGEALTRLLKALDEAYAITNDVHSEAITLPIFQRITTPDDAGLALRGLRYMRELGMWPPGLELPDAALATSIELMIRADLLDQRERVRAMGVFERGWLDRARA